MEKLAFYFRKFSFSVVNAPIFHLLIGIACFSCDSFPSNFKYNLPSTTRALPTVILVDAVDKNWWKKLDE